MSEPKADSLLQRSEQLLVEASRSHLGVLLTGPYRIEILSDELPAASFEGSHYLLASLGNCRCASDAKAIRQFDAHARVPSGADQLALGHLPVTTEQISTYLPLMKKEILGTAYLRVLS